MDAPEEGATFDWAMTRIGRSETLIRQMAEQALAQGVSVILDLGFTKVEHRQSFAQWGRSLGYACELHWVDISAQERWNRVQSRNREKGESFAMEVTREMFDFMEGEWETPLEPDWGNSQLVIISD